MTTDQPLFLYDRAQKLLDEVRGVAAQFGINSRDKGFLQGLVADRIRTGSIGQRKWLADLERKVAEPEAD